MRGNFICKALFHENLRCTAVTASPILKPSFVQSHVGTSLLLSVRCMASTANQDSFTVSYLMNACGLSPESALSASKKVHFETPEKPDSVISFLKNHGFSQTQISRTIKVEPSLLLSKIEKTLLPKFEFFYSKGMSSLDLVKIFALYPRIMCRSSKDHIIPIYNFIKSFLLTDEKTIASLKRCPYLIYFNQETFLEPNIRLLRSSGVPESNIAWLLVAHPMVFLTSTGRFNEAVEAAKGYGLDPLKSAFVEAIRVIRSLKTSTWERKVDAYKRWGWSNEEILAAFGKHPSCMMKSEKKIMVVMDFFVNKLGCESSAVAHYPKFVCMSFEKRIVPRCSVIQVLMAKGLINKVNFVTLMGMSERLFLQKFVTCYEKQAPHLLKLYEEVKRKE
ncbi:hypothetical protein ACOSQ2_007676 [Xanthoceras sorbifolium]|uniref:Uncharacterized protein n=1 Tax=Xanthoceras sorbifolium TaxID=99658 RepID=A0ABQ8IB07_9ROSI|nr:hypothetical protein JRO89_XS03G0180900 [Xanthoceras sorbifolium]